MSAGIYVIENMTNGKKYIGQGINVKRRMFTKHRENVALNNAIKKYGEENFKKYVILYCESQEMVRYETACIKIFHSHVSENGYNITWGGEGTSGYKHSEKTKKLLSKLNFGEKHPQYNTHRSSETKQKISKNNPKINFGKHLLEETKLKISKARLGIHPSDEAKQKMSGAHLGKHPSDKTKRKMSEAQTGHIVSKETRTKISEGHKGKHPSDETRRKLSISHRKQIHLKGEL